MQLGLTATPKRRDNVDTYEYFGEPVYTYSLKEGINDGYLTPFKVRQIATTLDDYVYTPDDKVVEGEVEEGKRYREPSSTAPSRSRSASAIASSCSWTRSTSARRRWCSAPRRRMRRWCAT